VVLAYAEDVEPDLVGKLDLLHQVPQAPGGADVGGGDLREGVDAELHADILANTCVLKFCQQRA
jgi:hypothetical protein